MLRVAEDAARERLDRIAHALLVAAGHPASRATVKRWIEAGRVLVDGRRLAPSAAVGPGAVIEITPEPPPASEVEPDPGVVFHVLHDDPHLVVLDKPPGLVMHPARGHRGGTLVHGLLARGGFERAGAGLADPAGHARPGIVHRLDKGTSGVLVVARDEATREALKAQFQARTVERSYLAIAVGEARDATFDTLHGRHPRDRLRFSTRVRAGKRAVTHVRVLEPLIGATLVSCRLETGRTHQIRVHLAEVGGTPILGDPLYGRPPRDARVRAVGEELGRQALHAAILGFVHPATGARLRFETPPPLDMQRALERLRAAQ